MTRLLLGVFLLALLCMPAQAAKRVALVIGNSAYEHVGALANPKNDAEAVSTSLERLDFTVIKGVDLTRQAFEETVREFSRNMKGAEIALLYYAGHGLQVNGKNFLAPIDTKLIDETALDFETIQLNTIIKLMEREPRTNLVFLDACRNNPMAQSLARSMGTRSALVGRGLASVESGIGTLIAFATQPGNVALDGEGENSPFTEAFVKHIETPGEDIGVLMRRVRQDVIEDTDGRQVPWDNSSLTGSVILKPAAKPELEPDKNVEAASALRLQLDEMQKQLKQAQELAADAKKQALLAALPPENNTSELHATEEIELAERDFEIARNIDAQRGWQLYLRKHGNDPVFGPRAQRKIGAANGTLSDSYENRDEADYPGLGRSGRVKIQTALNARGHVVGATDGVFGPKTRNAIKEFQRSSGNKDTGFVDTRLLELLGIDSSKVIVETFVSDKEARTFNPDDLIALGEKQLITDTIACLGDRRLLIYGQRGERIYFVVAGKSDARSQLKLADKCGGTLATLDDLATSSFVYELFRNDPSFFRTRYNEQFNNTEKYGPMFGLKQDPGAFEPSGGWNWLDGNKSRFRNWFRGQPRNTGGFSSSARFYAQVNGQPEMANVDASQWGDFPGSSHAFIMQIEIKD